MDKKFPILVVEDDPVSRKLLETQLTKEGYQVETAENGIKALELFKKNFFPIVITDWMMPELDGLGLCHAIRERESKGYVFIVLLTARDSKTDIVSGLKSGADDYLTKPFNRAELLARINSGIRILNLEKSLKKANDEIRFLSITDPLTGCYNRGYLNERLPKEISRATRYKHPLSVLLCDLDHFKKVNDTHGHQVGDHVLKLFAGCIIGSIRNTVDWAVRYGGEEFLIVLPETNIAGAEAVAERLRRTTENIVIDTEDDSFSITASFGGSGMLCPEVPGLIEMEEMIRKADELLYKAKQEGRNRVLVQA
ncbi:MAG: diguanylate cyclase [Desulfobacteraceae bacterium]|nr:diguanylate cyclase [Desulfobacteraceae bacterium]